MDSRPILYIWKKARPETERAAIALMGAAYELAEEIDPKTTIILIR
jgi:hypothetical protein